MPFLDRVLTRSAIAIGVCLGILGALVLATTPSAHLGLAGLALVLIAPGAAITGALARRGHPTAVLATAVPALSLSVIILATVVLGASTSGLTSVSLGLALLAVVGTPGAIWVVRQPRRVGRRSRRPFLTTTGAGLLGLASVLGVAAVAMASISAEEARRPRVIQLYQEPRGDPGEGVVVAVRTVGERDLVCTVGLGTRDQDGAVARIASWPTFDITGETLWRGRVDPVALERGRALVATLECSGPGGTLDRWIEVRG